MSSIKVLNPVVYGWAVDGLLFGRDEMGNLMVLAWTDIACSGRLMVFDGEGGDCGRDDAAPATWIKCVIHYKI